MRRILPYALALTCVTATPLVAQIQIGAGPTFPSGDFGTSAQTGWMGMVGISPFALGPIKIRIEGDYGENNADASVVGGGKFKMYGGIASGTFGLGLFYLIGSAGYLNADFAGTNEWKPVFGGGAGVGLGLGPLHVFGEARYLTRDKLDFVPVMIGVKLGG
jgi:hypothetical protein